MGLIFQPGFSTRTIVTEPSDRGVRDLDGLEATRQISPRVLATGHCCSMHSGSSSNGLSFLGPQLGCAALARSTAAHTSSATAFGCWCGGHVFRVGSACDGQAEHLGIGHDRIGYLARTISIPNVLGTSAGPQRDPVLVAANDRNPPPPLFADLLHCGGRSATGPDQLLRRD